MEKKLLIIGAGAHGKVIAEIATALEYQTIVFVDDKNENAVGKIADIVQLKNEFDEGFVAIGNNQIRGKMHKLLRDAGYKIPVLVHPTAYVSATAVLGEGTVVEPMAVINANVFVGDGTIVSVSSVIDHDAHIGDYCHINAGAIVSAGANVQSYEKINVGNVIC